MIIVKILNKSFKRNERARDDNCAMKFNDVVI